MMETARRAPALIGASTSAVNLRWCSLFPLNDPTPRATLVTAVERSDPVDSVEALVDLELPIPSIAHLACGTSSE